MKACAAILAIAFFANGVASAAELPSRNAEGKPHAAKVRKCVIGDEQGIELPGGACMRISGYVDVGVSAGTLRH